MVDMTLTQAKDIAKSYCGSYDIKTLLLAKNGKILAIGEGFDGGYGRQSWCVTHMSKEDGSYYWSSYGFESYEDAAKCNLLKENEIIDILTL